MSSLVALQSSYLKSQTMQIAERRKCGEVSISPGINFLTLHCLFCEFDNVELDLFLNHMRNKHLSLVTADAIELFPPAQLETETKVLEVKVEVLDVQDTKATDIKLNSESEADPLLMEASSSKTDTDKFTIKIESYDENVDEEELPLMMEESNSKTDIDKFTMKIECYDENVDGGELPLISIMEKNTKYNSDKTESDAECPNLIHMLKIIELLQEHQSLWNSKLSSCYIRAERQQAIQSITNKMQEEFPTDNFDYKYVLRKVNKYKKMYFNYNKKQRLTKDDQKCFEKLHFLNGHTPTNEKTKECILCHKIVTTRNFVRHMQTRHQDNDAPQTNMEKNTKYNSYKTESDAECPNLIHMLKIIDLLQEHQSLWNLKLRSCYIPAERQQAIQSITNKMQEEFPTDNFDYKYVLRKVNKYKKMYFNYNKKQKLTKDDQKCFEKLHFLNGHAPTNGKTKECIFCHKIVTTRNLVRHMQTRHQDNDGPQTCELCGEEQPSLIRLKEHLRGAHLRYECDYCDGVFATFKSLNNHIEKLHSDKVHADKVHLPKYLKEKRPSECICEICGRQCKSKANLSNHRALVHLRLRPHVCLECGKSFNQKQKLNSHMNSVHLNQRNYICTVCSKGFYDRKTMVEHMRIHGDEKSFVCKICGNAFRQSAGLYSHMKTH